MRIALVVAATATLLFSPDAARAQPLLFGTPGRPIIHVQRGTQVELYAALENQADDTVYVRGISFAASDTALGTVIVSPFLVGGPDTLEGGFAWSGVVAVVNVAAGPGTSTQHRLDFEVTGGANPFDNQVVATITYVVDDSTETTDVPRAAPVGAGLSLFSAPNPSRSGTRATVTLPSPAHVRLAVYDLAGRVVRVLADGPQPAGARAYVWDGRNAAGRDASSGVYFLRLDTPLGSRQVRFVRLH